MWSGRPRVVVHVKSNKRTFFIYGVSHFHPLIEPPHLLCPLPPDNNSSMFFLRSHNQSPLYLFTFNSWITQSRNKNGGGPVAIPIVNEFGWHQKFINILSDITLALTVVYVGTEVIYFLSTYVFSKNLFTEFIQCSCWFQTKTRKARKVFPDQVGSSMGACLSPFGLHWQRNMHRTIKYRSTGGDYDLVDNSLICLGAQRTTLILVGKEGEIRSHDSRSENRPEFLLLSLCRHR
jgi:hypothetical protein